MRKPLLKSQGLKPHWLSCVASCIVAAAIPCKAWAQSRLAIASISPNIRADLRVISEMILYGSYAAGIGFAFIFWVDLQEARRRDAPLRAIDKAKVLMTALLALAFLSLPSLL